MILLGVKIFTLEKLIPEVHIRREFNTYLETFKSLAIIVLVGPSKEKYKKKERKLLILELGQYYIVGTVKKIMF